MFEYCPACEKPFRSRYDTINVPKALKSDTLKYQCSACLEDVKDFNPEVFSQVKAEAETKKTERVNSMIKQAEEIGDWSDVPIEIIREKSANMILTTSFTITGREIDREIEIISAECVYGMNIFRDVFNSFRDFFGGRSGASQKVLRDAKNVALSELKREALMVFADGVIGVNLAYSELSGGGKNGMLMIVASGTAVKLKPQR
jgi:uncharacterized protein YbjQ (UPF0145 family)